jgi:hypothetical protein
MLPPPSRYTRKCDEDVECIVALMNVEHEGVAVLTIDDGDDGRGSRRSQRRATSTPLSERELSSQTSVPKAVLKEVAARGSPVR